MTIADWIVKRLVDAGVTDVFALYGAGNAHLMDALYRSRDTINTICTAGEQGAGFAAEGYSKAKNGALGVCVVTSGPGALNAATGVANCFYDSVPVLFLCGQVATKVLRAPYSGLRQKGFQESPTADIFKPIAKRSIEVTDYRLVKETLDDAIEIALQGRPGPVVLSLPIDVLASQVPETWPSSLRDALGGPRDGVESSGLNTTLVHECLTKLCQAKRPVIIAGGGALSCADKVREFADRFNAPVFTTWNALEIAPYDWPLTGGTLGTYGGGRGRNFAVQQADFALVLGSRLSGRLFGGRPETFLRGAHGNIWHVDVDAAVLNECEQDLSALKRVLMNAYVDRWLNALRGFYVRPVTNYGERQQWLSDVRRWRDAYDPVKRWEGVETATGVNPYLFIRELSKLASSNAIVVSECGGQAVIMHQAFETKLGQRVFSSHGGSAMGQGLGLGIGAAIACPDRPVYCVVGDGGLTLSIADLNTLRIQHARLRNLYVIVIDNRCYGITAAWLRLHLAGRVSACGPDPESGYEAPNFLAVARAFGVDAVQINETTALATELALSGPRVLDVRCDGWQTYEPAIRGWDTPIEEMVPSLPEEEFLAQMKYVAPVGGWRERRSK